MLLFIIINLCQCIDKSNLLIPGHVIDKITNFYVKLEFNLALALLGLYVYYNYKKCSWKVAQMEKFQVVCIIVEFLCSH